MKKIFTLLLPLAIAASLSAQSVGKIVLTTNKPLTSAEPNSKIGIALNAPENVQPAVWVDANNNQTRDEPDENPAKFGDWEIKDYPVISQTMSVNGNITAIRVEWGNLASIDFSQSNLELTTINLKINSIRGENATSMVNSLPDRTGEAEGRLSIVELNNASEENLLTPADVAIATAKNWKVLSWNGTSEADYLGVAPAPLGKVVITTLKPSIGEDPESKLGIGLSAATSDQSGIWVDANNNETREEPAENPNSFQLWELTNFPISSQKMSINGNITQLTVKWCDISSMDFSNSNLFLNKIEVFANKIKDAEATNLMNSLPDRTGETAGTIIVFDEKYEWEENKFTTTDVQIATAKNWTVLAKDTNDQEVSYTGVITGLNNKRVELPVRVKYQNNKLFVDNIKEGSEILVYNLRGQIIYREKSNQQTTEINIPEGVYILKTNNRSIKINAKN